MNNTIIKGPLGRYQDDLKKDGFSYDEAQEKAVGHLQELYDDLIGQNNKEGGFFRKILGRSKVTPSMGPKGLYFWGGVGRGKTYLMDVFYDSLPFQEKMRIHFHRFMQQIHRQLRELQGKKNPLEIIGRDIAGQARILCFDEFFVSDITDAMILGGLMEQLFKRGVVLVATSNIEPDDLYKEGLQRDRFLPAIALINEHTRVLNVDGGTDYRLRTLQRAEIYHYPLDAGAEKSLADSFRRLAPDKTIKNKSIDVEGREIATRCIADDVLWCDFLDLCDGPRSQNDFIEISKEYHAVLLSNVPLLGVSTDDQARRFVNLVDEFYDRNVKLIISAAVAINELYSGGRLDFEFQRTQSRLLEMQSLEYLSRPHLG